MRAFIVSVYWGVILAIFWCVVGVASIFFGRSPTPAMFSEMQGALYLSYFSSVVLLVLWKMKIATWTMFFFWATTGTFALLMQSLFQTLLGEIEIAIAICCMSTVGIALAMYFRFKMVRFQETRMKEVRSTISEKTK